MLIIRSMEGPWIHIEPEGTHSTTMGDSHNLNYAKQRILDGTYEGGFIDFFSFFFSCYLLSRLMLITYALRLAVADSGWSECHFPPHIPLVFELSSLRHPFILSAFPLRLNSYLGYVCHIPEDYYLPQFHFFPFRQCIFCLASLRRQCHFL